MKRISLMVLALFAGLSLLQARPLNQKGPPKITKNEAEHIALKQFPGGMVMAAKLKTVEGKLVWSIAIAKPKSRETATVAVDAISGRIASGSNGKP